MKEVQPSGDDFQERSEQEWKARLLLREWQVFFGYASHFVQPLPPLEDVAENLVKHGIAESAYICDNGAWWADTADADRPTVISGVRKVKTGPVDLAMEPGLRRAQIQFPQVKSPYALEGLYQAANLRYQELHIFGGEAIPPRYLRAQLGKVSFVDDESIVTAYPQVKIFENGVILVYLRVISPDVPQTVRRFLRRYLNAPRSRFRRVLVPPALAYWAGLAGVVREPLSVIERMKAAWAQQKYKRVIAAAVVTEEDPAFTFHMVSMTAGVEEGVLKLTTNTLNELAPQILEQAKKTIGLGGNAFDSESAFLAAIESKRAEGENYEQTLERLQGELENEIAAKMGEVGQALSKSAVEFLTNRGMTFSDFCLNVMSSIAYVGGSRPSGPRSLGRFALIGSGRDNHVGGHWAGHQHIHLLRFRDQQATASANEKRYAADFGNIVARAFLTSDQVARKMLPSSSRLSDDVGAYITLNGTLWVHSRSSLEIQGEYADPNQGHLVYEQQVKAELLDYAYALHRRISESGSSPSASLEDSYAAQMDLARFELASHDSSHFGEIRDLVDQGLEAYGIKAYRGRMAEAMRVRELIASHKRERAMARFTLVLSAVAGALAIPGLATEVVAPLWQWRSWIQPQADAPRRLLFVGVATLFVTILLLAGAVWARRAGVKLQKL